MFFKKISNFTENIKSMKKEKQAKKICKNCYGKKFFTQMRAGKIYQNPCSCQIKKK